MSRAIWTPRFRQLPVELRHAGPRDLRDIVMRIRIRSDARPRAFRASPADFLLECGVREATSRTSLKNISLKA
jgi:hypothetical protein